MLHRSITASSLAIATVLAACSSAAPSAIPPPTADGVVEVVLRPELQHQTIHNFGASDAWSVQFVAEHWPAEKRERIADLLFSLEEDADGSPRGIGLSAWRFNIGAGSERQGGDSGIRDRWRRADSFLRDDGSFDAGAQAGQRAMLQEARERGVEQFYAFVNSPPVALTRNGLAHSSGGDSANLAPERYGAFAEYLRDVLLEVRRGEEIEFDYLSPVNEPQWDWEGGQEGSPWRNDEVAAFTRVLSPVLLDAGLETRIEIPETARLNYLYEVGDKPTRGDQARAFFSPASADDVGDLPNVARRLAAHSYFTTYPADTLRTVRQQQFQDRVATAVQAAIQVDSSEQCFHRICQNRGALTAAAFALTRSQHQHLAQAQFSCDTRQHLTIDQGSAHPAQVAFTAIGRFSVQRLGNYQSKN